MRFGVSRKKLMIIAGLVWIVAGANILHIGIDCWLSVDCNFFLLLLGAVVVFLVFFHLRIQQDVSQAPTPHIPKRRFKLPDGLFRCFWLDNHGIYDDYGYSHSALRSDAAMVYSDVLHRFIIGTYSHRHSFSAEQ